MPNHPISNPTDMPKSDKVDVMLQAEFDELWDTYKECRRNKDPLTNVYMQARKTWLKFLRAGFDANQVAKMLFPSDRLRHYTTLERYGAKIDIGKMLDKASKEFVEKNWTLFLQCGTDADVMAEKCYKPIAILDDNRIEEFLGKGISPQIVLKLHEAWLGSRSEDPDTLYPYLHALSRRLVCVCPLRDPIIKGFIDRHMNDYLLVDIVEENPDRWGDIGVDSTEYADEYVQYHLSTYGEEYLKGDKSLSDRPNEVTLNDFVNFFSMSDILHYTEDEDGFRNFVKDYVSADGTVDDLANKFIEEVGYPDHDTTELDAVFVLAKFDAATINLDTLVNNMNFDLLEQYDADYYRSILEEIGASAELIAKFPQNYEEDE